MNTFHINFHFSALIFHSFENVTITGEVSRSMLCTFGRWAVVFFSETHLMQHTCVYILWHTYRAFSSGAVLFLRLRSVSAWIYFRIWGVRSNRVISHCRLCILITEVKREMFCKKNLLISDLLNRILPNFVNWYSFFITFIRKLSKLCKGSSALNEHESNVLQEAVNSLLKEIDSYKKDKEK